MSVSTYDCWVLVSYDYFGNIESVDEIFLSKEEAEKELESHNTKWPKLKKELMNLGDYISECINNETRGDYV